MSCYTMIYILSNIRETKAVFVNCDAQTHTPPLPAQPAPKATDRHLPLVIRTVISKKKLFIYKICFDT
jgi:hypothetical protein